jgi:hypothetical protein
MNNTFLNEQINRFRTPWKESAFQLYFWIIVVFFGGIGIGLTIYEECFNEVFHINTISKSIATTFIGMIAGSLVDLNLSQNIKFVPSLTISTMGVAMVCTLLLLSAFKIDGFWSLLPAILGYLISMLIWILANADNNRLSDEGYLSSMKENVKKLENSLGDL